jgi:putative NADPH-quinone reductase
MRRIAIIQGHPDAAPHLGHALAEAYAAGAREAGHEVRIITPAGLDIPLLRSQQEFEHGTPPPDIAAAQEVLGWAEHWVVVMPVWLGDMPALLKAFLEQALRPGFAFRYKAKGWTEPAMRGRSGRIIATMGMPALLYRWWFGGGGVRVLEHSILRFVGLAPVGTTLVGRVGTLDAAGVARWEARLRVLGQRAA